MNGRVSILLLSMIVVTSRGRAEEVGGPSSVIYPRAEGVIRFSHEKHQKVDCARCHDTARRSTSVMDRNLPQEPVCRSCHDQARTDGAQKKITSAGCSFCHTAATSGDVPRQYYYPEAQIRFGHRLHVERGASCIDCHRFDGRSRALPLMATCRSCHEQRRAPQRCVVCHLAEKDGRLRTRFPSGTLRPSGSLKGDRHTLQFSRDHGATARTNNVYCQSCHSPQSCLRCHSGTLRPMSIHGGDYVKLHGQDARRNQTRCGSCHRLQSFCLGCHQASGLSSERGLGGFKPTTTQSFHPSEFVALRPGPGHHGASARRNLSTCVSCHKEETCIRCHGTTGMGRGGFSPHPPGFKTSPKCRSLSSRNQRVCHKCHAPGERALLCE